MQARGRTQFGKRSSRVKKLGNWKGIAIENTLQARTLRVIIRDWENRCGRRRKG